MEVLSVVNGYSGGCGLSTHAVSSRFIMNGSSALDTLPIN